MSVVTQRRRIWLLLRSVMHPAQSMYIGHSPFPITAVFLILALVIWYSILHRRTGRPLPPGPKRLPIIGNLFNMPTTIPSAEKYHELTQKYGTCCYSQSDSLDTEFYLFRRRYRLSFGPRPPYGHSGLARSRVRATRQALGDLLRQTSTCHDGSVSVVFSAGILCQVLIQFCAETQCWLGTYL